MLLAQAYGIKGITVDRQEDLSAAIATTINHPGPVLVDVKVRRNENCYPMVPAGKANEEMVGLAKPKRQFVVAAITCDSCGTPNPNNHKFCPECGNQL
jgi:acetolactate synthase I/II/III large subunit